MLPKRITHTLSFFVMLLQKSDKRSAEFVEKLSTFLEEEFQCHASSPKDFYKEFGYFPYKPDVMM